MKLYIESYIYKKLCSSTLHPLHHDFVLHLKKHDFIEKVNRVKGLEAKFYVKEEGILVPTIS